MTLLLYSVFTFTVASAKIGNISNAKNELYIREALDADGDKLIPLIEQLGYRLTADDVSVKIQLFSRNLDKIWVAEIDNTICGVISLTINNVLESPGFYARVGMLCVDESFRSAGIGKALISTAETYAEKIGCTRIFLTSSNYRVVAHQFYKKTGYQIPSTTYFEKSLSAKSDENL